MSVHYINSDSDLSRVAGTLSKASRIAIDLEFDRNFYRYGFNLCLMQIFDGSSCYLIDPLSRKVDIEQVFPVIENPDIKKITFAFGEDLRLLHSLGCFPRNIYDLNIATSLLNYPPCSLNALLEDVLNVDTGASSQRSNWFKRPLTENQIRYAAQDVLHLLDLHSLLHSEAEQKNISHWIQEENQVWDDLDYSDEDHNGVLKEKDKRNLSETEWHIYKALVSLREETARSYNKPGFQVIPNKLLKKMAVNRQLADNFLGLNGIFRKIKTPHFQQKLKKLIRQKENEARKMGLSPEKPAQKPLSKEEFRAMQRRKSEVNRFNTQIFKPVKDKLREEYGEQATTFIFSNRIIEQIVVGDTSELKEYKVDLLKSYSKQLKIDRSLVDELLSA
ncbi:ribonuclease D [Rhodohalobacter mucosus]|uniref:3'-5' exonuclease domain-containing protein n=1 Tax=Rhodohalobacter mucosus TaxID=2079485 RepID=A0A316TNV8_9BACT|nr:ribonuclease D [Rhodohalobacter mucosus]PWN06287.1 hypothetical protein DDZ15_10710 [Rhodohalobacter mucosus]